MNVWAFNFFPKRSQEVGRKWTHSKTEVKKGPRGFPSGEAHSHVCDRSAGCRRAVFLG